LERYFDASEERKHGDARRPPMKPYSRAVSEPFAITSPFKPMGDQPRAIEQLVHGVHDSRRYQTLLGATGTGKTFTIANVIERVKRPTLATR
jgi:superfamily II DNA or RNA helicase